MDILPLITLFIAGIIGGLYGSSVGGGALISFPLLLMLGLSTPAAIATQRLSAVFLESASSLKYYKEHKLNLKTGLIYGIVAGIGALIGSTITVAIDEKLLNLFVGIFFIIAVAIIIYENHTGIDNIKHKIRINVPTGIMIFFAGIYGGFFGVAFGTIVMIVFLLNKISIQNSAAISRIIGLILSITASVVFAFYGLINYTYAISLGFGFAIGSWIGIGFALKMGSKYFKFLMIIVILITIIGLFASCFDINFI